MRLQSRRPQRLQEISEWLRRREISPYDAIKLAVDLRRRQAQERPDPGSAAGEPDRQARAAAVLSELDALVGLADVKRHVREIHAFTAIQMRRSQAGLLHHGTGLHMIFTGNPGTGKTTVARLLARLFREIALLPRGHVVEVERADLVGEYIGHTAQRTRELIRQAVGGVLFIDEAYSLARGGEKDFGREAIDCLVRGMEEHRGELLLIMAGYPDEMEWFLDQNPGLRSRFPIHIRFPDYSHEELLHIGRTMWEGRQYRLSPDAVGFLHGLMRSSRWRAVDEGNARSIRNLVERSLRCQAVRLFERQDLTAEDLMAITRLDLERALASQGGSGAAGAIPTPF